MSQAEATESTAAPSTDAPAISLRGLRKEFGSVVAVDGIDLDIANGEFFSMLGPSGSGKTTVLRMVAGFETPTDGRVELGGADVTRHAPFARDVNTVFQDYALFPHMTVAQNVEYGLRVKRVPRAERRTRAQEALDQVRLDQYGDRRPGQLSGGQRQRVALARALVNRPRVLLLDEPLGALDLKLRREMQVELKELQRDLGITFLFVTHDQEEALTMSDRIAVFNEGRIEQVATPRDLYEQPATPFVAGFVGTSNVLDGDAARRAARRAGHLQRPTGEDPPPPRRLAGPDAGRGHRRGRRARGRLPRLCDPEHRRPRRRRHADRRPPEPAATRRGRRCRRGAPRSTSAGCGSTPVAAVAEPPPDTDLPPPPHSKEPS